MRCFPLLHIYIINPRGYYELMKRAHLHTILFPDCSYSYFSFAKAISLYSSYSWKASACFSFRTGYAVQHASELRRKAIVAIKFTHVCVCCPLSPDVSLTDWTVAGIGWPLVHSFYILTLLLTLTNREEEEKGKTK
jgi:hypothetical protein